MSNINEANINAQFETKMTLLKFIRKMWQNGLILENAANGTNTTEKEMITYIRQNYTREISLQEFGMQFHLSENIYPAILKEHFHITLSQYINHLRLEIRKTAIAGVHSSGHRGGIAEWISECKLLYTVF